MGRTPEALGIGIAGYREEQLALNGSQCPHDGVYGMIDGMKAPWRVVGKCAHIVGGLVKDASRVSWQDGCGRRGKMKEAQKDRGPRSHGSNRQIQLTRMRDDCCCWALTSLETRGVEGYRSERKKGEARQGKALRSVGNRPASKKGRTNNRACEGSGGAGRRS